VAALVRPGGLLVMSTLNRTPKAFALAILGAEYVLRWLPRGTHDWKKFLKPHEIIQPLQQYGLELVEMQGLVLNPLKWQWELSTRDVDVNYMVVLRRLS
jgi:2-polyprenyl-6-hydroxyphenyl methylase/3-demethylubiquinone-9 3-methyltransferase